MEPADIITTAVEPVVDEEAVEAELIIRIDMDTANPMATIPKPWQIESVGAAEWAARKLAAYQGLGDEYERNARYWSSLAKRARDAAAFFEGHLERWGIAQRTDERKTVPLSNGEIKTRKGRDKMTIDDTEAVLTWARGLDKHIADALIRARYDVPFSNLSPLAVFDDAIVEVGHIDTTTGEVVGTVYLDPAVRATPENVARVLAEHVPDEGMTAQAKLVRAAFAGDGQAPIPGTSVEAAAVTASVSTYSV